MSTQHYRADTYGARRSVGWLLKRAHALLIEQLEPVLEASGFTVTQWVVLMHLRDGLAINAAVLCEQLRHDSGALTRVLDQLEARGLLRRERSREDRRSVQLRLTDPGYATIEALMPAVVDKLNCALGAFSRAELSELTRLLKKLIGDLEAATAQGSRGGDDASPSRQREPA